MRNYDCVRCKGVKFECGINPCPRLEQTRIAKKKHDQLKKELFGASPSVFIGRQGYPNVFSGAMVTEHDNPDETDRPESWINKPLEDIAEMRYSLVRTKERMPVSAIDPTRKLQDIQEIAMASTAVDTEVHFKSKPTFKPKLDFITAPYGPSGELKKMNITENPKIPIKVEKIVDDELKAADQTLKLYDEVPVSQIQKILSVGLLGKDKKLVPTRWSITATDDIIGKSLINEVKEYDEIDEHLLFAHTALGNHFEVLLVPGKWCFENLESYVPGSIWVSPDEELRFMVDWEKYSGRTNYAINVTGAYYSARLAVLEYLKKIKRQAGVIVARELTPEYWMPVGVWQIRENVREAMKTKPVKFNSLQQALAEIHERNHAGARWESHSNLLQMLRSRNALLKYLI